MARQLQSSINKRVGRHRNSMSRRRTRPLFFAEAAQNIRAPLVGGPCPNLRHDSRVQGHPDRDSSSKIANRLVTE